MKKGLVFGLMLVFLGVTGTGVWAQVADDIKQFPTCKYCGMDRQQYAHSRVLVTYDDGSALGTCSLHCSALDMVVHMDKAPTQIMVGDYNTKNLIDAEKATWVIGGNKPGVMTKRAKWAFGNQADAAAFIKAEGGKQATFEEATQASFEDMYADSKMIRAKRKQKRMMQEKKQ